MNSDEKKALGQFIEQVKGGMEGIQRLLENGSEKPEDKKGSEVVATIVELLGTSLAERLAESLGLQTKGLEKSKGDEEEEDAVQLIKALNEYKKTKMGIKTSAILAIVEKLKDLK